MNTKEITILFWDNQVNFKLRDTQIGLGLRDGISLKYKAVYQFYSESEFDKILDKLGDDDLFLILVHVDRGNEDIGAKEFKLIIEEGRSVPEEKRKLISKGGGTGVYDYDGISSGIQMGRIIPYKKNQLFSNGDTNKKDDINNYPQFDYAILTALYENEYEAIEKLFDFDKHVYKTGTTIYRPGKLKHTDIKVITCFATKTGMVEASIIATEMIYLFCPKYIFMPGVCGGADDTKFGSVIVAEKVFIFQKGKVSDLKEKAADGDQILRLFYKNKELDKTKVTDHSGKKINLIIEKFEPESETIDIDIELVTLIKPELKNIENKINEPYAEHEKIKVQLEPMACSMMVINKEDYFDQTILPLERKTKAVEMESYGIARASKLANGGKTKSLIFKSVMDKTKLKDDNYKKKAAYTSAQFLKHLLESKVLV
jgi:nucleoside phosphorylase